MKIVEVIKKGGVIHCTTKEEATRILTLLNIMGKGWVKSPVYESKSHSLLEHDYWDVFMGNTIYNPWSSYSNVSIGQVAYGCIKNYKHIPVVNSTDIDGCYQYIEEHNIFVPLPWIKGRIFGETDILGQYKGATLINEYALDLSKSCQIKVNAFIKSALQAVWLYPHTIIYEILFNEKLILVSSNKLEYEKEQIYELLSNNYLTRLIYAKEKAKKGYYLK